jgi:hypothetical protein
LNPPSLSSAMFDAGLSTMYCSVCFIASYVVSPNDPAAKNSAAPPVANIAAMPKPIANTVSTTVSIVFFLPSDARVLSITLRRSGLSPKPATVASTTCSTSHRLILPSATFCLVFSISVRMPGSSAPSAVAISVLDLVLNEAGSTRESSGYFATVILRWVWSVSSLFLAWSSSSRNGGLISGDAPCGVASAIRSAILSTSLCCAAIWPSSEASSVAVEVIVSYSVSLIPALPPANLACLFLTSVALLLSTTSAVSLSAPLNAAISLSSDRPLRSPFSSPSAWRYPATGLSVDFIAASAEPSAGSFADGSKSAARTVMPSFEIRAITPGDSLGAYSVLDPPAMLPVVVVR